MWLSFHEGAFTLRELLLLLTVGVAGWGLLGTSGRSCTLCLNESKTFRFLVATTWQMLLCRSNDSTLNVLKQMWHGSRICGSAGSSSSTFDIPSKYRRADRGISGTATSQFSCCLWKYLGSDKFWFSFSFPHLAWNVKDSSKATVWGFRAEAGNFQRNTRRFQALIANQHFPHPESISKTIEQKSFKADSWLQTSSTGQEGVFKQQQGGRVSPHFPTPSSCQKKKAVLIKWASGLFKQEY